MRRRHIHGRFKHREGAHDGAEAALAALPELGKQTCRDRDINNHTTREWIGELVPHDLLVVCDRLTQKA